MKIKRTAKKKKRIDWDTARIIAGLEPTIFGLSGKKLRTLQTCVRYRKNVIISNLLIMEDNLPGSCFYIWTDTRTISPRLLMILDRDRGEVAILANMLKTYGVRHGTRSYEWKISAQVLVSALRVFHKNPETLKEITEAAATKKAFLALAALV